MFAAFQLPYKETNAFTKIVQDYLSGSDNLKPFYSFEPTLEGIKEAIEQKKNQAINRKVLVDVLKQQYASMPEDQQVEENINSLLEVNTYTVCTAHQPNLFTGPLYFIYKIIHAIKLADELKLQIPENHFVPVFYMGSEDADLEELNHFFIRDKKYEWKSSQTGAVGRMKIDKELVQLIAELENQLSVETFGKEWVELLKKHFTLDKTIQMAMFELVHALFSTFGLVVLIPDNGALKKEIVSLIEDEIIHQKSIEIVTSTSEKISTHYNVQAFARPINLFYLKENTRERIDEKNGVFSVVNTDISFTATDLKKEIHDHPERFSPNVILRGLFQEIILPNIAFIGGGGEVAYWLQLKDLFDHYKIPFPPLILRNSFLILEYQHVEVIEKLGVPLDILFHAPVDIMNYILQKEGKKPQLNGQVKELNQFYDALKAEAAAIDPTLLDHVESLKTKSGKQLLGLEKKMLRAERKKHEATQRQIKKLKEQLFPKGGLQERVENLGVYYSKWGSDFIRQLYENSLSLEQEFVTLHQTHSSNQHL